MTEYQKTLKNIILPKALEKYDLDVVKTDFFCQYTNVFYKIHDSAGKVYGMKICQEQSNKLEDNLCEVFFLSQLSDKVDFPVPQIVKSKDGMGVTLISSDVFDIPKRTILYKWIEGKEFEANRSVELFFELGRAMAQLHKATDGVSIPEKIKPKKWDNVFYFRDEGVVYKNEIFRDGFGNKGIVLYNEAIEFANRHLQSTIEKYPLILLHGDINPWNVLLCEGKLGIIDFEDSILGYPAQDIAVMLYYYRYNKEYKEFKESLISGYNSEIPIAKFDEFELEILMIARRLNFINYVLIIQDNPWEYINTSLKKVDDFMRIYL